MIINKDFDKFKSIVLDNDRREVLFKGDNWWYELNLQTSPWHEPVIKQDNIMISFVVSNYIYKINFSRGSHSNSIKIINGFIDSMWWFFANKYIVKRMLKNWDKANIQ